jgi:hypothetical protein
MMGQICSDLTQVILRDFLQRELPQERGHRFVAELTQPLQVSTINVTKMFLITNIK